MKKIGTLLLAITCLITVAPLASHAQQPQIDETLTRTAGKKPGAVITQTAVINATVASINYETREIVLRTAQGETWPLIADQSIVRFNQIKEGDRVTVKVKETLAITVAAPGEMPQQAPVTQTDRMTQQGRTVTDAGRIAATVEAINYKARTVTLRLQNGKTQSFVVDKSVNRFDAVKTGDLLLVSYVGSIAASIDKN